jgi:decaprenylphospho-beta-D-erythro-pentofuranosid-2-ulose 2-reductase
MEMTALVVGATASLAQPLCCGLASRGYTLVLAGRDAQELGILATDIRMRHGASCKTITADLLDADFSAEALLAEAGDITHLILASGAMGNGNIHDADDIARAVQLNYTVPAQIAALAAAHFAEKVGGNIVIISSIAGDRGRAKIAAYAGAKAALTAFASGLRQAYAKRGVHVLTVKPGLTDTPMTWGIKTPLMARREAVAKKIIRAMEKRKDVVYAPWFWRIIMLVIVHIPEKIFKRLSF